MPMKNESFDFTEFNKSVNMKGLMEDFQKAESGQGDFEDVPDGLYEVSIEKMALKMSKNNNPMLTIWFNIVNGTNKGQKIFYNQTVHTGYGLHLALDMLRSFDRIENDDIKWENDFNKLRDLILDVYEACDEDKASFVLDYGTDKKGFHTYVIKEVLS